MRLIMRILVIEDDENKLNQVTEILRSIKDVHIISKRSYQSGLKAVIEDGFDLIVLDMSMPTFDKSSSESGGRFRKFAGKEILAEIKRRKIHVKAILVTGFDTFGEGSTFITLKEMNSILLNNFSDIYLGSIFYNASETNWTEELVKYIISISRGEHV